MKQWLILVYNFFKNPDSSPAKDQSVGFKIKWLFFLLVLELPLMFIAGQMQQFLFKNGLVSSEGHLAKEFMHGNSPLLIVALMIVILPFIEELIFRLPLRFKRAYLIPFIITCISFMGYNFLKIMGTHILIAIFISIFSTVVIFLALYNHRISERFEHIWSSNYRAVFYAVASLFALYHLTNFKFSISLLIFAPIVVLPQFIGGLFMGFLRVKQGLLWGFFLHALHNAFFVLPVLLMPENTPKLINQINKEGYTFITTEGNYFNNDEFRKSHPFTSTGKITPNEIVLHDEFKNIVAKLSHNNKRYILFKNSMLSEKKISVYFKNDSVFENLSSSAVHHLVLENLLEAYKLKSKMELQEIGNWELSVYDEEIFKSHCSEQKNVGDNNLRSFMGKNDTLKFVDTNSDFIAKSMGIAFDMEVKNKIAKKPVFSIEIPNDDFSILNTYLKTNYGLKIEKKSEKEKVLVIY